MTAVPQLDDSTALAVERTRMAHDRTLMAWVRTSVSLISFGFTIYKFFEYLRESPVVQDEAPVQGPRHFALAMILAGLATLLLAAFQYQGDVRRLQARYGRQPRSLVAPLALLIGTLGIAGLAMVYLHR